MRYQIVLSDPAWSYGDKSLHRGGAERHFSTMSGRDLGYLNVANICADDCVLFMWATHPVMCQGTPAYVANRWGFELKTCAFDWVKTNADGSPAIGMGHWTRSNSEPCYLGIRGKPERLSAGVRQIVEWAEDPESQPEVLKAPRPRKDGVVIHSAKPAIVRDRIVELCGDLPRIELFARGDVPEGWHSWGNEASESAVSL